MSGLPRSVLVTGGGTGIGRAVAAALRERGSRVVVAGRREGPLRETARATGAEPLVADVTGDPRWLLDAAGSLDGLVHAAGHHVHAPAGAWTAADWEALWRVHVLGPAMLSQSFAGRLRGPGSILAICSTLAVRSAPGSAAYASAKAALLSLVRSLALELAPRGIRANALLPGIVQTAMTAAPRDGCSPEDWRRRLAAMHPLGRTGRPEEVAAAAVALLENPWVTGAALEVDGGLLAR